MNYLIKRLLIAVFVFCAFIPMKAAAVTPEVPAAPVDYVTDLAGVLNPEVKARLSGVLRELDEKTTSQVFVLTVDSIDGGSMEEFTINTAMKWKAGRKGKDNGVLIAVAVKDRKYRIEVGYGLEGTLPDSLVGSIGRTYFVPNFRQGDFSSGIASGTLAVSSKIAESVGVELTGVQIRRADKGRGNAKYGKLIIPLIFIIFFIISIFSRRGRHGGGFWIGGGGFGGGLGGGGLGGGGFGGGGGGSFGGGGGGGDW